MHVLLTGGTGCIGPSVLSSLVEHGHRVTAAVRDQQKADGIDAAGGTGVVADLADHDRLVQLMRDSDAVIHTASDPDDPQGFDRRVAEAAIAARPAGRRRQGPGDRRLAADPAVPARRAARLLTRVRRPGRST